MATTRPRIYRALNWCALGITLCGAAVAIYVFTAFPLGHPRQETTAFLAGCAGGIAFLLALYAGHGRRDRLSQVAAASGAILFLLAVLPQALFRPHLDSRHRAVAGEVRQMVHVQHVYRDWNAGLFESRLECLTRPSACLPDQTSKGLITKEQAELPSRDGYLYTLHSPPLREEALPEGASPTSVGSFAYTAVPEEVGWTGQHSFCGDSGGNVCILDDRRTPALTASGTCELAACFVVENQLKEQTNELPGTDQNRPVSTR